MAALKIFILNKVIHSANELAVIWWKIIFYFNMSFSNSLDIVHSILLQLP